MQATAASFAVQVYVLTALSIEIVVFWDVNTIKLGRWVADFYQHIDVRPQKSEVLSFFPPSSPVYISVLTKMQLEFCSYEN